MAGEIRRGGCSNYPQDGRRQHAGLSVPQAVLAASLDEGIRRWRGWEILKVAVICPPEMVGF